MCLPDFLGIGAQRAGTTWLFNMLKQHPEVCMDKNRKETRYFDRYYDKGEDWYASRFKHCKEEHCVGEISPDYFHKKKVSERIYELLPDIKLLLVLRNPIERVYSQYKIIVRDKGYSESFSSFIENNKDAIDRGFYFKHISRYLNYFPEKNLQIMFLKDIKNSPKRQIKEVYEFLNVDPNFEPQETSKKINYSQIPNYHGFYTVLKQLSNIFHEKNLSWLVRILKNFGLKDVFFSGPGNETSFSPLGEDDYMMLEEIYQKDIANLSELLHKDLFEYWELKDEKR